MATPEELARRRAKYAADGGKIREYNQRWKDANRERTKEVNRESARKMRAEDPERFRKTWKQWRENNPEAARAAHQKWYAKNGKEYFNKWMREDRRDNPVRYMWRNSRNRAKEIGVEFTLQPSDIVIPETCPVLGTKLEVGGGKGGSWKNFASPSIDRFDNTKGYTPDNIRIISWRANMLKRDATLAEIEAVASYMRGERQ